MRPGLSRPRELSLVSTGSLALSFSDPGLLSPSTPNPDRQNFREVTGGVAIIFFDFDGTLTATPGDRAARGKKLSELCSRATMLKPRLNAFREAGVTLGIISKSTEVTIRDALDAACLADLFNGPIIGKAVGFEGKAGIIEEMTRSGTLRLPKGHSWQATMRSTLLVDDDVLELDRARRMGLQAFAAPAEGGLQDDDLQVILGGLQRPCGKLPGVLCKQHAQSEPLPGKPAKWRNYIVFAGDMTLFES